MSALLRKLNWMNQTCLVLLNAPEGFQDLLAQGEELPIADDLHEVKTAAFFLAFVVTQQQVEELSKRVAEKSDGDTILWFAYPKGTSKRFKSEVNRDKSWACVGQLGFEPVRQISIDTDWTALRFRRAEYIKTMKRDQTRALSATGREKTTRSR